MCKQLIHHFRKLPRVLRGAEMVGWSFYLVLRRLHAVRFQQCCSNCTAIHSLPPRSNKLVCDIKLDVCRLKTNWKRRLRDTSAVSPVSFNPCSQWKTHYYRTHHHPNIRTTFSCFLVILRALPPLIYYTFVFIHKAFLAVILKVV